MLSEEAATRGFFCLLTDKTDSMCVCRCAGSWQSHWQCMLLQHNLGQLKMENCNRFCFALGFFASNFLIDGTGGKNWQNKTKSGFAVWKQADFFHFRCGMCGCPNVKVCRLTGNSSGPPLCYLTLAIHFGNSLDTAQQWNMSCFPSIKTPKRLHHHPFVGGKTLWMTWDGKNSHTGQETLENYTLHNMELSSAAWLHLVILCNSLDRHLKRLVHYINQVAKKKKNLKTSAMSRPDYWRC